MTYNNRPVVPYERRRIIYEGTGMFANEADWTPDVDRFYATGMDHGDVYETDPYPSIGEYNFIQPGEGDGYLSAIGDIHGTYNFHQLARLSGRRVHLYNALVFEIQTFFRDTPSFRYISGEDDKSSMMGLAEPATTGSDPTVFVGLFKDGAGVYKFGHFYTGSAVVSEDVTAHIIESSTVGDEFKLQVLTIVLRSGDGIADGGGGTVAELYIDRELVSTLQLPHYGACVSPFFFTPSDAGCYIFWTYFSFYYRYVMNQVRGGN